MNDKLVVKDLLKDLPKRKTEGFFNAYRHENLKIILVDDKRFTLTYDHKQKEFGLQFCVVRNNYELNTHPVDYLTVDEYEQIKPYIEEYILQNI